MDYTKLITELLEKVTNEKILKFVYIFLKNNIDTEG